MRNHAQNKLINVIGLGYIGLPTAALLASKGYTVLGSDIDPHVVEVINQGRIHIVEPDLDAFVRSAFVAGRLVAFVAPQLADIYIICVPTPFRIVDKLHQPDISHVLAAVRSIAPLLKADDMVILESTSPVGTTEKLQEVLMDEGVNIQEIHIAYCPERVLPGNIMAELVENDRIIGGLTEKATQYAADFYRGFVRGAVFETNAKTAEMCKLTENSFRDVNIAFANELSLICDRVGINVWELISLANRHPRVNILQPGVGVGGHCIAVDPWFIVAIDAKNAKLIRAGREINDYKTNWVIEKIKIAVADFSIKKGRIPKIACMGLAFKPDIDDLRESPALQIAIRLKELGYDLFVVEPNIPEYDGLNLISSTEALEKADVFSILVKHKEFIRPDIKKRLRLMGALDFCGALV